jgi:hypothetical protein
MIAKSKSKWLETLLEGKDDKIKAQVEKYMDLIFDNTNGIATITAELLAHLIVDSMQKMKED